MNECHIQAIRFIVQCRPLGYRVARNHAWNEVQKDYRAWRDRCCEAANLAGIQTPLFSSAKAPIDVSCIAYYDKGIHADPGNTHKGLIDALFRGALGGDKFVSGSFAAPRYDKEHPRLEVFLRGWPVLRYPELAMEITTCQGNITYTATKR